MLLPPSLEHFHLEIAERDAARGTLEVFDEVDDILDELEKMATSKSVNFPKLKTVKLHCAEESMEEDRMWEILNDIEYGPRFKQVFDDAEIRLEYGTR